MTTIVVCGGRDLHDRDKVFRVLDAAHAKRPISLLVHPMTIGAVALATDWADAHEIRTRAVVAQRDRLTGSAISIRNSTIMNLEPDGVIAFPSDGDKDSEDLIERAKRANIPVWRPFG